MVRFSSVRSKFQCTDAIQGGLRVELRGATALDAYMLTRHGIRGLYDEDTQVETPMTALLRAADAYSGDWLPGVYGAVAGVGASFGKLGTIPDGVTRTAVVAGIRAACQKLLPAGQITNDTPLWAISEVLLATSDSHARAIGLHLQNLARGRGNSAFALECICSSLGLWSHTSDGGEALFAAAFAIYDSALSAIAATTSGAPYAAA